jgi:succinate dehydrogenase/fumarate reductase flavoprotein subunit
MIDLVVVGGGMAGLAAAARAAEQGLRVVVLEKTGGVGGSAALSAGILWTAPDVETMREVVPDGDPELGRVLVDGLEPAVERVRAAGVAVSDRWDGQMGFGVAYRADIHALLAHWVETIERAGGEIRLNAPVRGLRFDGGAVTGAGDVAARAVLLATGGFQGDTELVARFLGPDADRMLLRSNPGSTGDGFRLAVSAGAAAARGLAGFYGHLVPAPLNAFAPEHYLPLTQYHSRHSILADLQGRRFCDESLGDEVSNQAALRLPRRRALLLCDERVRREHVIGPPYPHGQVIDRFALGASLGANLASADTIDALLAQVATWGFDAAGLERTLIAYERGGPQDAPLPAEPVPLREPPFHAIEVQPTLTFTLGGIRVDADGRVLDRDGGVIEGLYAAGGDAGGLQGPRYVAGLALGLVFGPRAADAVMMDKGGDRWAQATTPTS